MLALDRLFPHADAVRTERRVVGVPVSVAYNAALSTDFADIARTNAIVKALFTMRSMAERCVAFLSRRPYAEPPKPAVLKLDRMPTLGDWVRLGGDAPREVVFGAIGRFWAGETRWVPTSAEDFSAFDGPGYAKIGCHLTFTRMGDGATLVTYEVKTTATDAASRRAFRRYWRVVSPFVGMVMRATLGLIGQNAIAADRRAESPSGTLRPA